MAGFEYCKAVDEHRQRVGATKVAVAQMLNISEQSALNKLNGKTEFSISEASALADRWGLSIDELVGR